MHSAALAYIATHIPPGTDSILEFGSRNINGTPRSVSTVSRYVGVDIAPGHGVDIVCDASTVEVDGEFDVVVCAEVFEHADDGTCSAIAANAHRHLRSGGVFLATMAGPGRAPHSAVDGGEVRDGEFYRNVEGPLLAQWLLAAGFVDCDVETRGPDTRCTAVKP